MTMEKKFIKIGKTTLYIFESEIEYYTNKLSGKGNIHKQDVITIEVESGYQEVIKNDDIREIISEIKEPIKSKRNKQENI